uniref:Uncharacterized protein n=1 Tax=Zeugodacus cucurbitae TaxID=28588 RepID=A0A0A1WYH8_ZEUCU
MTLPEKLIQNEVPDFLGEDLVFCDMVWLNCKQSLVVLARDLKCYLFYQKQLVNSIDLSETCLKNVSQNVYDYKGPKSKWFKFVNTRIEDPLVSISLSETSEQQTSTFPEEHISTDLKISFGKFVYRNFKIHKVYLLIQFWDKFLAIALPDFVLITQFEGVHKYRIIHGKEKFEALLELKFENGNITHTNFQKCESVNSSLSNGNGSNDRRNLKQLMERVRCAKAELQLYKSTTQKEFDILRDLQKFGCNYIRSDQLEEKPMISRCGDIWLRIVTNNVVVLGVALVNNCSTNSMIVTKNLKPIFKMKDSLADNIIYKYRIYQLNLKFENLETLESFFQTEDQDLQTTPTMWSKCETNQVLPSSFAVLLIAIKMSELLLLEECPLLLYFEVEKEPPRNKDHLRKTEIYEQHIFLRNLNISNIIMNQQKYKLSFETTTFHQDFLATAMVNKESTLRIQFESVKDAFIFEQLIAKKFNFDTLKRNPNHNQFATNDDNPNERGVAEDLLSQKHFISCIYFNKVCTSLWFGSMALKISQAGESEDNNQIWKVYFHNKENTFNCLKLLLNELTVLNCNIKTIDYFNDNKNESTDASLVNIKNGIVSELEVLRRINECIDGGSRKIIVGELLKKQVRTDSLMNV